MTVQDYMRLLRRHWLIVVIGLVLGLGASAGASLLTTPQYQASSKLFVSTQSSGTNSDLLQGGNFAQQRVRSYADVATSPEVLGPVIQDLGLDATPEQLAKRVRASAQADTVLLSISTVDPSAEQSVRITDAVAAQLVSTIDDLERPAQGSSPVKATVVQPAATPTAPVTPNIPRNVALGGVLGLLLGVGVALLRETLDTKVRTSDDLRKVTDATLLGAVPFDKAAVDVPLVIHSGPNGPRAEALRHVRTNLQFVNAATNPKSVVVTSSMPGEGKSSTSVNLGITLAEAGQRVCLIEADLRRPKAANYLGLEGSVGLTTVLIGSIDLQDALQPFGGLTGPGMLDVLAAGQVPPNPSELLGSQAMTDLLRTLEADYDMVILDAPPVLPVTDASILAGHCDGVIVVVGSGRAEAKGLARTLESLETVEAQVVGVMMNRTAVSKRAGYYGYSYEYKAHPKGDGKRGAGKGKKVRSTAPAQAQSVQAVTPAAKPGTAEPVEDAPHPTAHAQTLLPRQS